MSSKYFFEKENPIGDYLLNEEIGSGGFAKVVEGIHIPTGEKVAVKIMDKAQIFSEPLNLNRIQREIAILKLVRHNNIIKLYELMETPDKIYMVMEYCNGGELFDYIVSKQHLTERQACRFFQEIINSLEYLHSLNIAHRDIKPENILLCKIKNKIDLKLIDFGISNCYTMDKLLNTPCGTASYAPPEMHKGDEYYGLLSDIWSAGVVLYAMVFGYLPFCEDDEDINISNIIQGNYEIPDEASPELADLLIHLLDINPLTRYDLEQIKEHPWFNMVKNYKYIPGVIEGYNKIPIDIKIVEMCEQYGYDKNQVLENVQKCNYNKNSAVYYILLNKMKREGYHSISDLCSDEFLKYINNPKNLILDDNINDNNNKTKDDKTIEKNISRHQSHPIADNKFIKDKSNKYDKDKIIKKDVQKFEKKNKSINQKQKPAAKRKNEKNELQNKKVFNNNISIQVKDISNKIQNNNNPPINKNIKNIKKESKKINKSIPKRNNHSFSQSKKPEKKEKQKIKNKQNKKIIPKIDLSEINKTYQTQSIKTEIINSNNNSQNINKNIMPICSFHLASKTRQLLNKINNNEDINIDFINASFNKKLSDDVKENILKLKNPKKNIPQKEKAKKINNALLSLKLKKKRKKKLPNNQKINFGIKPNNIFKEIVPNKQHTIIHNRNASLFLENRGKKIKNFNIDKIEDKSWDKNLNSRNEFYYSPNIKQRPESNERRNIINIYVHNKNNINSNNIYNINLITKNNYSIDNKSNDYKNRNINIKVKKIKVTNQNIKKIQKKTFINNNEELNTTNISNLSITNRNRKHDFHTPNKSRFIHSEQLNNIHIIENKNKSQSQRNNKKENIINKNLYNNSFNNIDKNKKKIRLIFKSTEENRENSIYNNLSFSKKDNKKPKNMKNNNINNINTNRYYHYKSRSLMDIDNPHYQKIDNYTITENRKFENNFSLKFIKNSAIRNNHSTKQRKKVVNISYINLPTLSGNNNNNKQIEIKKYKGPIDLKCILYTKNIISLIEKIVDLLKKNKMNVIYIGFHKLRCTKNCQSYDIEFFELNDNSKNNNRQYNINSHHINTSDNCSYLYENNNEENLKTLSGYSSYKMSKNKNNNIYYYTITSKVCNNKKLMKIISKIIYTKFNIHQIKKEEKRKCI